MDFHDVQFPTRLALGSVVGPQFSTDVVETAGGFEVRNQNWSGARLRFNVAPGVRTREEYEELLAFFYARAGRAFAFRFPDWSDFQSGPIPGTIAADDQLLGTGDGAEPYFQLRKAYVSGAFTYWRTITRPRAGTVRVALGGIEQMAGWSVDTATGLIAFDDPVDAEVEVTAGFAFDVPARFDIDSLEPAWPWTEYVALPEVPLVEVRE